MKKLISLLLVSLMMFCGVAAAESSIDLSAMSLDELVELHSALDAEIDARTGCDRSILPVGVYVAGESIKPGNYTITAPESQFPKIYVFDSEATMNQYKEKNDDALLILYAYLAPGDSAFVTLTDGMVLVTNDPAEIEATAADWIP